MSDRRKPSDRRLYRDRRGRSRRRQARNELPLVIEISHSTLTALSVQGEPDSEKVAARTIPWRQQATSLRSEEGRAELGVAFRELAKKEGPPGRSLHVVLSGEFCVTRAFRGTIEEVRREIQGLDERSRLYLSLGPGEKAVVTSVRDLDARHQHALAAICNQGTLDAIYDAAERAGFQIAAIEPALCAACRAAGRLEDLPDEPCILIHYDADALEVGVFRNSDLALDYRPGGNATVSDLPALLERHNNRLRRHAARQLGGNPTPLTRVYLCGDREQVAAAVDQFETTDFQVEAIAPGAVQATWQLDAETGQDVTIPAIGGLLAAYQAPADRQFPNLLDHIVARSREPLRPILVRSAIPLAATLLIAVGMIVVNAMKQRELDELESQLALQAPQRARAAALIEQIVANQSKLGEMKALATRLNTPLGNQAMLAIGNCMPADVWLSGFSMTHGQTVQIAGSGFNDTGVYDFVHWLEQAPQFAEVALQSTRPASSEVGDITQFDMQLSLVAPHDLAAKEGRHE